MNWIDPFPGEFEMRVAEVYYDSPSFVSVAEATPAERAIFFRKTYGHVAASLAVLAVLEAILLNSPAIALVPIMAGSNITWLISIGLFMWASHVAEKWSLSAASSQKQYQGLGLYLIAEAVILMPLLFVAVSMTRGPEIILQAGVLTLTLAAALTLTAFTTKTDFSFLGAILKVGFIVAVGVMLLSMVFGFTLGLVFCGAMILLAAGSILYSTQQMVHAYRPTQHVAAALGIVANIALLFWYILSFIMRMSRR